MAGETMIRTSGTKPSTGPAPVVIDLGEKSKKSIKRLRRGGGKLMAQIQEAIRELETAGKVAPNAQPVIVVVEQELESMFGW